MILIAWLVALMVYAVITLCWLGWMMVKAVIVPFQWAYRVHRARRART